MRCGERRGRGRSARTFPAWFAGGASAHSSMTSLTSLSTSHIAPTGRPWTPFVDVDYTRKKTSHKSPVRSPRIEIRGGSASRAAGADEPTLHMQMLGFAHLLASLGFGDQRS